MEIGRKQRWYGITQPKELNNIEEEEPVNRRKYCKKCIKQCRQHFTIQHQNITRPEYDQAGIFNHETKKHHIFHSPSLCFCVTWPISGLFSICIRPFSHFSFAIKFLLNNVRFIVSCSIQYLHLQSPLITDCLIFSFIYIYIYFF